VVYDKLHKFSLMDGLLAAGLALITVGVGVGIKDKLQNLNPKAELIKAKVSPVVLQVNNKVVFDISGEVIKPGVYQLPGGSRISEAMAVAGGLAVNADREWVELNINRAKRIMDGEKIFIPKKVNREQLTVNRGISRMPTQVLGVQNSGLININTASAEELDKLSGVGPAIAQKIIEYRLKNGGFRDINEIKMVSGIGDKMFEKIKDEIGI
jgi:competence protein ComEA